MDHLEDENGGGADYAWKVGAFGVISMFLPLLAMVFPRSEAVRPALFAVGLALGCANLVTGLTLARRNLGADQFVFPSPRVSLALLLSHVLSVVAFDLAIGPGSALLRLLLIIPLVLTATVGDRRMMIYVGAAALVAFAVMTAAADPQPGESLPRIVIELVAIIGVVGIVRVFVEIALRNAHLAMVYGAISDVAATAETIEEGLARALPLVADYLGARTVAVCAIGEQSDTSVVALWPSQEETGFAIGLAPSMMERAMADNEPIVGHGHCIIPITAGGGLPLVAVALRTTTSAQQRLALADRVRLAATQLNVLVSRMNMIERLETLTRTDSLTGIANRRSLMERLAHELKAARRTGQSLTAVMVDLDNFKQFNDAYGHLAGDEALVAVATLLHHRLRTTDLVARFGGEEFCIVLAGTKAGTGRLIMDELRRIVANLDSPRRLTFSAGIAEWDGRETVEALLTRADDALYVAKSAGRDQCRVFGERRPSQPMTARPLPPDSVSLN